MVVVEGVRARKRNGEVRRTFTALALVAWSSRVTASVGFGRSKQDGVVSVCLYVLLQILGALEGLATEVAFVRLQGNVNANMRGNVITLYSGGTAVTPLASQIQVVCALATNMALANVVLGDG
jgi:hypothetical protein